MKKAFVLLFISVFVLFGCGNDAEVEDTESGTVETEKHTEMLDSGVNYFLTLMTGKYSSAYIAATTSEEKATYLVQAKNDINIAITEIEDEYEEGVEPTDELLELANHLLDAIDNELEGNPQEAYDNAFEAGEIIGSLSSEYLDGELPTGIKIMTEDKGTED